ncbi:hypothetical protein ACFFNY_21495 [Paenibacillus hodogayensis]|uniref:Amidohydrolase n=1 Tax=Paenibacillus hodogayensis TaxID=279208 RepID=A0ABV5W148_9BACL
MENSDERIIAIDTHLDEYAEWEDEDDRWRPSVAAERVLKDRAGAVRGKRRSSSL